VVADTVRGKGLPSISARADRWFCNFSPQEIEMLLEELEGSCEAQLKTEVIVAR
jgi:transketolase